MIRIKICGLTTPQDARNAVAAGADAVGINFVGGPRRIDLQQASEILAALPPFCTPVALVDVTDGIANDIQNLLDRFRVNHLQLYGRVSPVPLAQLADRGFRTILVQHATPGDFASRITQTLADLGSTRPDAVLLDAHRQGMKGGTGEVFDWHALAAARAGGETATWPPLILAGGLNPDNIADAVNEVRPQAVDVSSGVEVEPGRKDEALMRAFIDQARTTAPHV